MSVPELLGNGTRDGPLPRARRAVDGNDELTHGLPFCHASGVERLQKILSRAGVASRRAGEKLMLEGRVTVNGTTIRELGTKADPERDDIRVDGRRIEIVSRHLYLLLNKPRGYVSTRSDPERRPTVIDLLHGVPDYLYPVGR